MPNTNWTDCSDKLCIRIDNSDFYVFVSETNIHMKNHNYGSRNYSYRLISKLLLDSDAGPFLTESLLSRVVMFKLTTDGYNHKIQVNHFKNSSSVDEITQFIEQDLAIRHLHGI